MDRRTVLKASLLLLPTIATADSIDTCIGKNLNPFSSPFRILRYTKMPAVLIELFNMNNEEQLDEHQNGGLTKRIQYIADGLKLYREQQPDLKYVIFDDGHGQRTTGYRNWLDNIPDEQRTERFFSTRATEYFCEELDRMGLEHQVLSFTEAPETLNETRKQRYSRIDHYVEHANRIMSDRNLHRREVAYISFHADNAYSQKLRKKIFEARPTHVYILRGASKESKLLATSILKTVTPHSCAVMQS